MRWSEHDRESWDARARDGCAYLGALVRRRRERALLSQRALAALADVSQTTICRLERGELRAISLVKLGRIIGVLGGLIPSDPLPPHLGLGRYWG
jgi:transcriptional regulator with XRE-family HTH domain